MTAGTEMKFQCWSSQTTINEWYSVSLNVYVGLHYYQSDYSSTNIPLSLQLPFQIIQSVLCCLLSNGSFLVVQPFMLITLHRHSSSCSNSCSSSSNLPLLLLLLHVQLLLLLLLLLHYYYNGKAIMLHSSFYALQQQCM